MKGITLLVTSQWLKGLAPYLPPEEPASMFEDQKVLHFPLGSSIEWSVQSRVEWLLLLGIFVVNIFGLANG